MAVAVPPFTLVRLVRGFVSGLVAGGLPDGRGGRRGAVTGFGLVRP